MPVYTKCIRLPLIYDDVQTIKFVEFINIYREIQNQIRVLKNKVSNDYWLLQNERQKQYEADKKWPKFSKTSFSNEEYHKYKELAPLYQTGNLSQCIVSEVSILANHQKEVLKGVRTIDTFKANQPVTLKSNSIKLINDGSRKLAQISVFSTLIKKKFPVKQCYTMFILSLKSPSLRAIVDRCLSGEYKVCASTLNYDKKKRHFELALTYSFEKEIEVSLDANKVLGVDLGINNAYYAATNFSPYRFYEEGGDIRSFSLKVEKERTSRKRQRANCFEGSIGHALTSLIT